ncbi:uncharacterized protein HMPREF1541_08601 [Cyphellophora europaea CBS 101466]|uniref:C2H2-type domain-containing protein n=1 Tax=Cyphellophora europaea (strain CBS 101466) TaxID=1220924 RepID=W2RKR7_CYPE1|nr:uncharacterized protein HMPREF1541_08601 [Cyphellophora europaea CBS 101466]ETN36324.1 hypothetical protein HMPREF1541_08601 [Cyphellophora europaea CBS 101466]
MHAYFGPNALSELPDQEVVEDNSHDEDMAAQKSKNRNRRASEGSHLIKGDKKSGSDLRCDTCGKGYKHSSCLTKHMWEHDPAWAITSKLLISKHQQVQLLEAASVLCNINAEVQAEMDVSQVDPSEVSSASPEYSGSSEIPDELSSVETTPPPMSEGYPVPSSKRYSGGSNLSRSYRSMHSSSYADSVVSPGFPPAKLSGVSDFRPTTSGTDDGVLAAATAGLNFSNTPRTRASVMNSDVPPVPPLPQQYQSYNSKSSDSTLTNVYSPMGMHPPAFAHNISDERHYRAGSDDRHTDHFRRSSSHGEDEEMFKMDES